MARKDREELKNRPLSSAGMLRLPEELDELKQGETAIVDGKAFMRVEIENDKNQLN